MPVLFTIQPWPDPVIDTVGHDPRSLYVETFWLPTLGPTALLLLRHLAGRFDESPRGVELQVGETSQALGLGDRVGNSSPIVRTLSRLEQFDLACADPHTPTVAVRRNLPPINRRHVRRLPAHLQAAHADWAEVRLGESPLAEARRRARRLALVLLEQGDDADHVERALFATGFHPSICHEAARWAWQRHRDAAQEAGLDAPT
jgi:hypothetical protein